MAIVPRWKIPRMDDPLGKHWRQPANLRDRVGIYWNHVTISERDWFALSNYETANPSGVYPGKVWRRGKYLRWYGPDRDNKCRLVTFRALVQ